MPRGPIAAYKAGSYASFTLLLLVQLRKPAGSAINACTALEKFGNLVALLGPAAFCGPPGDCFPLVPLKLTLKIRDMNIGSSQLVHDGLSKFGGSGGATKVASPEFALCNGGEHSLLEVVGHIILAEVPQHHDRA